MDLKQRLTDFLKYYNRYTEEDEETIIRNYLAVQELEDEGKEELTFHVEKGPAGPILYYGPHPCNSWLGTKYNDAADNLCKRLNAANES